MAEETHLPELKRLLEVVVQKVDGLASDVRTNTYKLDGVESRLGRVESKFDRIDSGMDRMETKIESIDAVLKSVNEGLMELKDEFRVVSGQFNDVGSMAIKDHKRIDDLEQRADILEQKPH
jgi:chromosome segregation ATPase